MKYYPLKEVAKLSDIDMFVLVEYLNEKGYDIELDEAFDYEDISEHYLQLVLEEKVIIKQRELLRVAEINHKLKYLKNKKDKLDEEWGASRNFEAVSNFINEELEKINSFIATINKLRHQMMDYIEGPYMPRNSDKNNRYYIYNSYGFVMEVGTLEEAREQARQFNGVIKDIRDNTVR
ncbi:hypothetical protein FPZ42_07695 [Mucilaginibacter achroorhodeus]|uniref:Uncharacterized protein n=1 Tax=Mucilaginibacter achroorhodeus TaxID=2599294 RepID=A0A563U6H2_9SPHI|nr:hypothetical protein [Mucilaginibacter achroorhodeus]TWR26909.1 hypothetical protein FPZ42_07695 [Mucilaginibacter achroorhodeus]